MMLTIFAVHWVPWSRASKGSESNFQFFISNMPFWPPKYSSSTYRWHNLRWISQRAAVMPLAQLEGIDCSSAPNVAMPNRGSSYAGLLDFYNSILSFLQFIATQSQNELAASSRGLSGRVLFQGWGWVPRCPGPSVIFPRGVYHPHQKWSPTEDTGQERWSVLCINGLINIS